MFALIRTEIASGPFGLMTFLSLLLIGGDLIAIQVGGLTLRIVFPLLMGTIAFMFMRGPQEVNFNKPLLFMFSWLALAGATSTTVSFAPGKSIGYTFWVLFNFFIIITLCYNFSRYKPPLTVLSLWFWIFRIHVALAALSFFYIVLTTHALATRPHLWFYEASYLAIFLVGYFGAALYLVLNDGRRWLPDLFIALLGIICTASATGLAGVAMTVILNAVISQNRLKLIVIAAILSSIFLGTLFLFFQKTGYYDLMASFVLNPKFSADVLIGRGGNRWVRALVGLQAFQQHPWFGVGIGGDAAYMEHTSFSDYVWQYMNNWSGIDEAGQPFVNIIIEVLGTMGIMGFLPFLVILIYSVMTAIRIRKLPDYQYPLAAFMAFWSMFLALQFEGTFLRYYLWTAYGLAFGMIGRLKPKSDQLAAPIEG